MTDNGFAVPTTAGTWKPAEALGHLLVIYVHELVERVSTSYGDAEALRCTIHDITERETYDDALIFTGSIIGSLRSLIGKRVLVRLEHGRAKPGQNPPYVLQPRNEVADDVEDAMAYLSARGPVAEPEAKPVAPVRDAELQAALEELMRRKTVAEGTDQIPF